MNIYTTCDKTIRKPLMAYLRSRYEYHSEFKIIPELGLKNGSVRVDIAVIGKIMHGYELKSDRDDLMRLTQQSRIYNLVFDKMTIVVGKKHIFDILSLIPEWWGIILAKQTFGSENVQLLTIREARTNPLQNKMSVASMLWKNEALYLLSTVEQLKGYANKPKEFVCKRLVEALEEDELKLSVRNQLLRRFSYSPTD